MSEGEHTRLVAWCTEMRRAHDRLRDALRLVQQSLDEGGETPHSTRDLLVFCHGFCRALSGHHEGEDRELFPAIAAAHPELRDTLRKLRQDHAMIAHLLGGVQSAVDRPASRAELGRHLEGVAAIMESHFRYEERQLLSVLQTLDLSADVRSVFGPL